MSIDASYDPIADWYDDWLGEGSQSADGDPFYTPLLPLFGDVDGQLVLDLACGQGRVSRHLAERGARVVGVDASTALLSIANRYRREAEQIEYRHDDAHTLTSCSDEEFDGVVCNMALMDIPDLSATVRSAFRVLRPGGWFAFSTLHPCFNAPLSAEIVDQQGRSHRTVTDYFTEGFWQSDRRKGPPKLVGAYHRTLTTYLNTMIEAGFVIERVQEILGLAQCWLEVPPVLAMACRKVPQPADRSAA